MTSKMPSHISSKAPKERTKRNRKSLKNDSNFWDLQGSCHLKDFSWTSNCFGFDSNLGRSYYTSFCVYNEEYSVGDFICIEKDACPDMFRIVAVFQALKSFHGEIDGHDREIQKRGHPYVLIVPLIMHDKIGIYDYKGRYVIKDDNEIHYFESKKRKRCSNEIHDHIYDNELFLKDECKPYENYIYTSNVVVLPEWIGYWQKDSIRKIKVKICNHPSEKIRKNGKEDYIVRYHFNLSNKRYCKRLKRMTERKHELPELSPLNPEQISVLTYPKQKLAIFLPSSWDDRIKAKQVQYISHKRSNKFKIPYIQESDCSSDDSDGFDEESTNILFPFSDKNDQPLPQLVIVGQPYNHDKVCDIQKQEAFQKDFLTLSKSFFNADKILKAKEIINTFNNLQCLLKQKNRCSQPMGDFVDEMETKKEKIKSSKIYSTIYNQHKTILQQKLNKSEFRDNQAEVCLAASMKLDLIYVGPPGIGKSICYIVPALYEKGITIIIEPLNAIIKQQVQRYSNGGIKCEKLLSHMDEMSDRKPRAERRLAQIVYEMQTHTFKGPMILYITPELLNQEKVLIQLQRASEYGMLHRIVMDEFDEALNASESHRSAYLGLLPYVLKRMPKLNYSLFSATFKPDELKGLLGSINDLDKERKKPSFFKSEVFIPENLIYSVERKLKLEQAIQRTVSILNVVNKNGTIKKENIPKTICYCLTRERCEKVRNMFQNNHGINAEVYHSKISDIEKDRILKEFSNGTIRIICATTSLGRGVDIIDIRFVFHFMPPTSLSNYIQETGRAGRDGKISKCVFFYRPQDETIVKHILGLEKLFNTMTENTISLNEKERKKKIADMHDVREYALCGDTHICRKDKLKFKTSFAGQNETTKSHKNKKVLCCDLCHPLFDVNKPITNKRSLGIDISNLVFDFLLKFMKKVDEGVGMRKTHIKDFFRSTLKDSLPVELNESDKKYLLQIFRAYGTDFSLVEDLIRLLLNNCILTIGHDQPYFKTSNIIFDRQNISHFMKQLKDKEVKLKIMHTGQHFEDDNVSDEDDYKNEQVCEKMSTSESLVYDLEQSDHEFNKLKLGQIFDKLDDEITEQQCSLIKKPDIDRRFMKVMPFLVKFELYRLYHTIKEPIQSHSFENKVMDKIRDESWDWNNRLNSCIFLHKISATNIRGAGYKEALNEYEMSDEIIPFDSGPVLQKEGMFFGAFLYYSAELILSANTLYLELQPPERAANRRIYRKYGSHRFLDVRVTPDIPKKKVMKLFLEPIWICGRLYRFLWAKKDKSPQIYVLFAEKGEEIDEIEETSVNEVQNWMIPSKLNESLGIGKYFKRAKLSFSKTIPAGQLPDECVEIVADIKSKLGNIMTDGCGLVSRDLMDDLIASYNAYIEMENDLFGRTEHKFIKNATSFQARVGGIKGEWCLDPALTGKKLVCRESQVKYKLPMKCLKKKKSMYNNDDFYDTIDICSWDEDGEESKTLNVRLIQILEHRGVDIDFFRSCADSGTSWISKMKRDLEKGNNKTLINRRPEKIADENERGSYDLLFELALANVRINEPVMAKLVRKLWSSQTKSMRDKAKYPVDGCQYLRMIPDHYNFLEEGEAYVAVPGISIKSKYVLAMRSPAYFAGDLVKLKVLTKEMLVSRFEQTQNSRKSTKSFDQLMFFTSLRTGLILSTRGERSAADMMSGGDFDGDKAWVCWNETLVHQVCRCDPVDTSSEDFNVRKSAEENALFYQATSEDVVKYVWHHRNHHTNLGKLSKMLDIAIDFYGFDHDVSNALGTQSFLQVDHPYYLCKVKESILQQYLNDTQNEGEPYWLKKNDSSKFYKKENAMGTLYEFMENLIQEINDSRIKQDKSKHHNKHIAAVISKRESKDQQLVNELRQKMRNCLLEANKEVSEYLKSTKYSDGTLTSRKTWFTNHYNKWKEKLLKREDSRDQIQLIACLLYEQAADQSILKSTDHYESISDFPWMIASKTLSEVTTDGDIKEGVVTGFNILVNSTLANSLRTKTK